MAHLECKHQQFLESYPLDEHCSIGRDNSNDIKLQDDKSSRFHAEIRREKDGRYLLKDLQSSNGTWNATGKLSELYLEDHSTFRIGRTYFTFYANTENSHTQKFNDSISITSNETIFDERAISETYGLNSATSFIHQADSKHEQREHNNRFFRILHELILDLRDCELEDDIFECFDDLCSEHLENERCALFLINSREKHKKDTPYTVKMWPPQQSRLRARFGALPFSQSLTQLCLQSGKALACNFSNEESDMAPSLSMVEAGVHAALAAPIFAGEEPIGLIYVDRFAEEHDEDFLNDDQDKSDRIEVFSNNDLAFFSAAAEHIGAALRNKEIRSKLEEQLRDIQIHQRQKRLCPLIGSETFISRLQKQINEAAQHNEILCIYGPVSSGKKLIAQHIHQHKAQHNAVFSAVRCQSQDPTGFRKRLFGYGQNPGQIELCHQGTLLLQNCEYLSPEDQARIISLYHTQEIQRLDDNRRIPVSIRLILSTNTNISSNTIPEYFTERFYELLQKNTIACPPLQKRNECLKPLLEYYLEQAAANAAEKTKKLKAAVLASLSAYHWPENIGELMRLCQRLHSLCETPYIQLDEIPDHYRHNESDSANSETHINENTEHGQNSYGFTRLADVERAHILAMLNACDGNKKACAELLGIDRSTLYAKLRNFQDS